MIINGSADFLVFCERLQGDYVRVQEGNANLSERLQDAKLENKTLRGTAADYERAKRAFGLEEVERAVEEVQSQETMERKTQQIKRQKHYRCGK